jgi:hypothetical protein
MGALTPLAGDQRSAPRADWAPANGTFQKVLVMANTSSPASRAAARYAGAIGNLRRSTPDLRRAGTAAARAAFVQRFRDAVNPHGTLREEEATRRAMELRRAWYAHVTLCRVTRRKTMPLADWLARYAPPVDGHP